LYVKKVGVDIDGSGMRNIVPWRESDSIDLFVSES
jgi:hypothetical protein